MWSRLGTVAVIGFGKVTESHLVSFRRIGGVEVVGVVPDARRFPNSLLARLPDKDSWEDRRGTGRRRTPAECLFLNPGKFRRPRFA